MLYIAPSLLAADFSDLQNEIRRMEDAGANYLHLDIMDGHFVPNISFGAGLVRSIRRHTRLFFDVHLMISDPLRYAEDFIRAGADIITFHCEASRHVDRTLQLIRDHGMKSGLVFNPATPLTYLDYELDRIDVVLLMSVNPGFGGQSFIGATLDKIRAVREKLNRYEAETGRRIALEVDGGIKPANIAEVALAGADTFVAGSAVFGAGNAAGYADVISRMKAAVAALE